MHIVSKVRYPKVVNFKWVRMESKGEHYDFYCSFAVYSDEHRAGKPHWRIGPYRVCDNCYEKITSIKVPT